MMTYGCTSYRLCRGISLIKGPQGNMGVSKNRGKTPKMDGENNGKPY